MLSADEARPTELLKDGLGIANSQFTYAVGSLVLWSKNADPVKGEETLKNARFVELSICNPIVAPYGAAAIETMKSLTHYDTLKPKFVEGKNVTQAYEFVAAGNAEIGFFVIRISLAS